MEEVNNNLAVVVVGDVRLEGCYDIAELVGIAEDMLSSKTNIIKYLTARRDAKIKSTGNYFG